MSKLIQIVGILSTFVVLYGCTTAQPVRPVVIQQPAPTVVVPAPRYEQGPGPNDAYNGPGPNDAYNGPGPNDGYEGGPGPNDDYEDEGEPGPRGPGPNDSF